MTPDDVASFGHAMTFPPFLVVARRFAGLVDTPFRIHVLESEEGALHPRVEDLVITMLKVDPFAARAVALGNPEFLDPVHLLRRVLQERVEREATLVRLQEISPGLPTVGAPLPLRGLRTQDRQRPAVGIL